MKKLGFILMALILALGAIGVGYAAWTDEIYIDGTVNTGSVDINVEAVSYTEVYKTSDPEHGIMFKHVTDYADNTPDLVMWSADGENWSETNTATLIQPAVSTTTATAGDDTIRYTLSNVFPLDNMVWADAILCYEGTVPCKINSIQYQAWGDVDGNWLQDQIQAGNIYALAREYDCETGVINMNETIDEDTQLHMDDCIWVGLYIELPQEDALMNRSGGFDAILEVVQWNEYQHTPFPTLPPTPTFPAS